MFGTGRGSSRPVKALGKENNIILLEGCTLPILKGKKDLLQLSVTRSGESQGFVLRGLMSGRLFQS
jgi:hypothetical protein